MTYTTLRLPMVKSVVKFGRGFTIVEYTMFEAKWYDLFDV